MLKRYSNKEKPVLDILVEFYQNEHYNALRDEPCSPEVYTEKAGKREMIVVCETKEEALNVAKYHFSMTGSDFKVKCILNNYSNL